MTKEEDGAICWLLCSFWGPFLPWLIQSLHFSKTHTKEEGGIDRSEVIERNCPVRQPSFYFLNTYF